MIKPTRHGEGEFAAECGCIGHLVQFYIKQAIDEKIHHLKREHEDGVDRYRMFGQKMPDSMVAYYEEHTGDLGKAKDVILAFPKCPENEGERNLQEAKIPSHLGKCDIIHRHDDGDLTVKCQDVKYVVTTEGEIFKEVQHAKGS